MCEAEAIGGVMGAHAILYPHAKVEIRQQDGGVVFGTHIGGFLMGIVLGYLFSVKQR